MQQGPPYACREVTAAHRIGLVVNAHAFAAFREATIVSVPADFTASSPTTIAVRGDDPTVAAAGHLVVELGANSSAVVVLDYSGSATYADNVEFVVGDGARLSVVSLQDWADDAVHLSHQRVLVGKDASVSHTVVSLGGGVVRVAPSVRYAGPGGNAELRGLYFADAGQHLEHRLLVDHAEPNCRSRVTYKGALQGGHALTLQVSGHSAAASAQELQHTGIAIRLAGLVSHGCPLRVLGRSLPGPCA